MSRRGGRHAVAVVAVLALAATAACSGDGSEGLRPAASGAKSGGQLTVGILAPKSIAPWLTTSHDPYGTLVVRTMCDSLLATDPRTGKIVGAVAERYRQQGPAGIVLRLREDVVFNDGSTVSAADVMASVSRVADSETASPVAGALEDVGGYEDLHGLKRLDADGDRRDLLDGVFSPERRSVEIGLSKDNASFLPTLAHPLATPVPKKAFEDDPKRLASQPICVGPYRLERPWTKKDSALTLVRSKSYLGSAAYTGEGRGYADRIVFRVYPTLSAMYAAYRAKKLDVAFAPPEKAAEARALPGFVAAPSGLVNLVGLPTAKEPFDNPLVRLALSLALDRTALADQVGGFQVPATRVLPPNLDPAYAQSKGCQLSVPKKADPDAAAAALRGARVALKSAPVTLYYNDEFDNKKLVDAVARQWRTNLGLVVKTQPMQWEDFIQEGRSAAGITGPFRYSWAPEVVTADGYLVPLFSGDSAQQDNLTRFSLPGFEEMITKDPRPEERAAREEINEDERRKVYLDAEKIVCNLLPMLPVTFGQRGLLFNLDRVQRTDDVWADRSHGLPALRGLTVKA